MISRILVLLFVNYQCISTQSWNTSDGILPWESYIKLNDIQRPLGLTLNRSSLAHHHFTIGYVCLHSFMYDEATDAFNLAINIDPTLIEAHIGKMLACKHPLWSYTNIKCGLDAYNVAKSMLQSSNVTLSSLQSTLLSTVYQWYSNESSISTGEQAFLSSIADLARVYPNETDIRVLWGLSLLNKAFGIEFQNQIEPSPMVLARDILQVVFNEQSNHSGALHYLIQSYDIAQYNISEKAIDYLSTYDKLTDTLSYPKHLLSHIWMRTGSLLMAKLSDERSIQASLTLCFIKITGRIVTVNSTQLTSILAELNKDDQVSSFLLCDNTNRAYATEWLSYSRLQTGDWLGTLSLINDLSIAYNRSLATTNNYLLVAYRSLARAAVNLFYWLPYDIKIIDKIEELQKVGAVLPFVSLADKDTDIDLAWSEAGYRLSDCLRLLLLNNTNYNKSTTQFIIEQHLTRFSVLSNRTASLNQYISTSISMMILQIQGIILFQNNSHQECLTILNEATQRELNLVIDNNSPILIFARSLELFAMHLLLIERKYQNSTDSVTPSSFMINGISVQLSEFPQRALNLYQIANQSAPNRAINILGMARANAQLRKNDEAAKFYKILLSQINSLNNSDAIFSQEAKDFLIQIETIKNTANMINCGWFFFIIIIALKNI